MHTPKPLTSAAPAIHVVDDDADFRDALAWLFDSRGHLVQSWDSGQAFLDMAAGERPHWMPAVVLLDIRMEPMSGLSTFEALNAMGCPWPVLFLTGHGDVGMAVQTVKNGAWDFLEKPFQDNELVDKVEAALRKVQSDESRLEQRLRRALESLSQREREVLEQLLQGHYNKNIADHLGITQRTVEFHRANIFEKMGVNSAVELAHLMGRFQLSSGAPAGAADPQR
ncbi:response regulator transcription factor [Hydrogenophaga aquatica]